MATGGESRFDPRRTEDTTLTLIFITTFHRAAGQIRRSTRSWDASLSLPLAFS